MACSTTQTFEPGICRSIVTIDGKEALKVHYTIGGTTPGDSYIWMLDDQYMPTSYKMYVPSMNIKRCRSHLGKLDRNSIGNHAPQKPHIIKRESTEYGRCKRIQRMNSKIIANGILRALGIITGITLLCFFLYVVRSVLVYIAVAAVIALIARPFIIFLRRRLKFPNTLAVATTMTIFVMLFLALISMFIPLVVEQGKSLSLLESQSEGLKDNLQSLHYRNQCVF